MPKKFNYPRNFDGIWIPKEVYLRTDLGAIEKILLVEISSLDCENGCYASNKYLADFLQVSLATLKRALLTLLEKNLIKKDGTHNNVRVLRAVHNPVDNPTVDSKKSTPPKAQIEPQSKTNTSSSLNSDIPVSKDTVISASTAQSATSPPKSGEIIKTLIQDFASRYLKRTGTRAAINWKWWAKAFSSYLRDHRPEEICKVMDRFFAYEKRTQFGFNKFELAFNNLAPAVIGHATASPKGWKCPKCSYLNNHTGGFCLQCRFELGGTDE